MVDERLITPEYQQALRDTHAAAPWGEFGSRYISGFMPLLRELDCWTLLDYGSGIESLRQAIERDNPEIGVRCYDQGVIGREALPEPADFVVCTDVLEHVEPELIDNVLKHISSLVVKGAYLRIGLAKAKRALKDGRNAHILLQPRQWWLAKLKQHGFHIVKEDGGKKTLIVWVRKPAIDREAEQLKYEFAYEHSKYRMGVKRGADARRDLESLPIRGSYLDVSCGRGEMLDFATSIGFVPVKGTEIVPKLIDGVRVVRAWAHKLPFLDEQYNVVTLLDVIEHLLPGDDERACRELARVACNCVIITANNRPSFNKRGDDLHVNKRPYEEWDRLFRAWFAPYEVTWIKSPERLYVSEAWKITKKLRLR